MVCHQDFSKNSLGVGLILSTWVWYHKMLKYTWRYGEKIQSQIIATIPQLHEYSQSNKNTRG